jgi:hypothetical protein
MSNIYDQFDAQLSGHQPPTAPPDIPAEPPAIGTALLAGLPFGIGYGLGAGQAEPPPPGAPKPANIYDQFDNPSGEPPTSLSGVSRNLAAGMTSGLISDTLGLPVNLATAGLNLGGRGINAAAGHDVIPPIQEPIGGSEWIDRQLGNSIGVGRGAVKPQNAAERIAQSVGGVTGQALGQWGAARVLAPLATPTSVTGRVLKAVSDVGPVGSAIAGAGAGLGGGIAEEVAPEPYKPLAGLAGQLVGGGAAALGSAATAKAGQLGWQVARDLVGPQLPKIGGRITNEMAAERLLGAFREALHPDTPEQIIPGSQPTTFQLTGDTGIGQMERGARTTGAGPFLDRAVEQNAARVQAIQDLAHADANPGAVRDLFTSHLAAMDQAAEQSTQAARTAAEAQFAGLGGTGARADYGAAMRDQLEANKAAAKAAESKLWKTIDPNGDLAIDASPAIQRENEIRSAMSGSAKPMEGEEAAIFNRVREFPQQFPGAVPFQEVADLRGRLLAAIRNEREVNGQTPALRRMQGLRGAIDDTIATGAQRVADQQTAAVAAGTMSPEDTWYANLLKWQRDHAAAQLGNAEVAQGGVRGSAFTNAAGGSGGISSGSRGASQAGGRIGYPPNNQGLPGEAQPLTPNFDAEAAARYRAAADAHRNMAQTFKTGPVDAVLRAGPNGTPYRLTETQVPERFIGTSEGVQAYLNAGGNPETLQQALVGDLRRTATNPDGTLNTRAYQRWLNQRADPLRSFPDLQGRLQSAAGAQDAVDAVASMAADRIREYQQSAARHFLNAEPSQAVQSAFASKNPRADFAQLAQMTESDPAARAGLQRAIVDHMLGRTLSNTEAGSTGVRQIKSDVFQSYLERNRAALQRVFSPDQMEAMQAVAEDLQRSNRSITSKIAGSPGTAQDIALSEAKMSMLGHLLRFLPAGIGGLVGGIPGAVGGWATSNTAMAIRRAGLKKVEDVVADALLNPERARTLLMEYTPRSAPRIAARLASQYGASAARAGLDEAQRPEDTSAEQAAKVVSKLGPGEPVTRRVLAEATNLRNPEKLDAVRAELVRRGIVTTENGRYLRAATANKPEGIAPSASVSEPVSGPGAQMPHPLADQLYEALHERARDLRRQDFDRLVSEIEGKPSPVYGGLNSTDRPVAFLDHTATAPATHEDVYLLKRTRFFPEGEWRALVSKSEGWADQFGVPDSLPAGVRREEAIARAYNAWQRGDTKQPPGIRRIFGGMTELRDRIAP